MSGFHNSNMEINQLNTASIQVVLPNGAHRETNLKVAIKMQEQQSTISEIAGQVRPAVWNISVNSKGGHKHVADLHKFSALVAHSCAEAEAIFGH